MKTIPYAFTRAALSTPGLSDDVFDCGADLAEPALYAEMARVAYVKERDRLARYLGRAGFQLVEPFGGERGVEGFIARSESSCVLAFRGTESDLREGRPRTRQLHERRPREPRELDGMAR